MRWLLAQRGLAQSSCVLTEWCAAPTVVHEDPGLSTGAPSDRCEELEAHIAALEHGPADVRVLKKLALFLREQPVNEPISPISPDFAGSSATPSPAWTLKADLWSQGKAFERLFAALLQYLDPTARVRPSLLLPGG